jgi:RNA polymerase sigma-70 factor (ECF subfamily)
MEGAEKTGGSAAADRNEVLEHVMAEYESALLRYATRILRDPSAAQDVVQDTFIRFNRHCSNGSRPPAQVRAWLYRVTHNGAVDHIRRESRLRLLHEKQADEMEHSAPPGQGRELEEAERMNMALTAIGRLKPEEQQVIILRLQEGLSYKEIARITKRSEGNVGCILHHAVRKVSGSLKKAGVI